MGVQATGLCAALLFAALQICHPTATGRHRFALVFGTLIFFVLLTPIHELAPQVNPDPTTGMIAVGAATSGLLVLLWRVTSARHAAAGAQPSGGSSLPIG